MPCTLEKLPTGCYHALEARVLVDPTTTWINKPEEENATNTCNSPRTV